MAVGTTRGLVWLAIVAIALQTVFSGLAPGAGAQSLAFDPAGIICHSGTSAASEQAPPASAPSHQCDHCILCSANLGTGAPQAPAIGALVLSRGESLLPPLSAIAAVRSHAGPHLPRGPPLIV